MSGTTQPSEHQRILLVEDDPCVGSQMAEALEQADFEVDGPHADLAGAMAAITRHFPDFAMLDLKLGKQDAAMLAQDLETYGIPFAFCSGGAPGRSARQFPASPFLRKPFTAEALIQMVRGCLH